MEEIAIELKNRDVTGKAVRRLRDQGMVPAVIHDHGKDSVIVMGSAVDLLKAYHQAGKHHPVSLKTEKKEYMAIIKEAEFDPKKHQLRHIVFNAVNANQTVTTEVPIHMVFAEGNEVSPAERAGFVVLSQLEAVEVEALPKYLPDFLEFDGEKLVEVGDQATVADIKPVEHVVVTTDAAHPLATVFEPSALQAANDDAGGDEEEITETEKPEGETVADAAKGGEENADTAKAEKKD